MNSLTSRPRSPISATTMTSAAVAGHHAQQHALCRRRCRRTGPGAGRAHGEQRVDRAHAGVQRLAHRVAFHRVDRAPHHRLGAHIVQRAPAVQRPAVRVDHAAEQAVAHRQVQPAVLAAPPGVVLGAESRRRMRRRQRLHHGAAGQALQLAGGHQEGAVAIEAHDLGRHRRLAIGAHLAHRPHRHAHARGFEHQAGDAHQRAAGRQRLRQRGIVLQIAEEAAPARAARGGRVHAAGSASAGASSQAARCRASPRPAASAWRCAHRPGPGRARPGSRHVRRRAAPAQRAPRACSASTAAGGDQRMVVGVHQHADVARSAAPRPPPAWRPRPRVRGGSRDLGAAPPARQQHGAARHRSAICGSSASSCSPKARSSGPAGPSSASRRTA